MVFKELIKKKKFVIIFTLIPLLIVSIIVFFLTQKPFQHKCLFNIEEANSLTLASEATCYKKGTFYYSCECGNISNNTFEIGDFAHKLTYKTADGDPSSFWECSECSGCFYDANGIYPIEIQEDITEPKDEHDCIFSDIVSDLYLASAASCSEKAKYFKSCQNCGAKSEQTFSSGDLESHSYQNIKKASALMKNATNCLENAIYYQSCENCGAFGKTTFLGESGKHDYRMLLTSEACISPATCTTPSAYYKTCALCDKISQNDADIFNSGATIPHSYNNENETAEAIKSAATCTKVAVYYKSCDCGKISTAQKDTFEGKETLPHIYDVETTSSITKKIDAHCKSGAIYYKSCECGKVSENDSDTFTVEDPIKELHVLNGKVMDYSVPLPYGYKGITEFIDHSSSCQEYGDGYFTCGACFLVVSVKTYRPHTGANEEIYTDVIDGKTVIMKKFTCQMCGEEIIEEVTN